MLAETRNIFFDQTELNTILLALDEEKTEAQLTEYEDVEVSDKTGEHLLVYACVPHQFSQSYKIKNNYLLRMLYQFLIHLVEYVLEIK